MVIREGSFGNARGPLRYVRNGRGGFTLIEVTIVMAITGLMAVLFIAGQGVLRSQAEFGDAVERIRTDMAEIRNEANTTVNVAPGAAGSNTGCEVAGRVVKMANGDQQLTSYTLTTPSNGAGGYWISDPTAYQIPWGVHYVPSGGAGSPVYIIFVRDGQGNLQTYNAGSWGNPPVGNGPCSGQQAGGGLPGVQNSIAYHFVDMGNHSADVRLDAAAQTITTENVQ